MKFPFGKRKTSGDDLDDGFDDDFDLAEAAGDDDDVDLDDFDNLDDDASEATASRRQILAVVGIGVALVLAVIGGTAVFFFGGSEEEVAGPAKLDAPADVPSASLDLPPIAGTVVPPAGGGAKPVVGPSGAGGADAVTAASGAAGLLTPPKQASEEDAARARFEDSPAAARPARPANAQRQDQGDISPSQRAVQNLRALTLNATRAETDPDRGRVIPFATQAAYARLTEIAGTGALPRVPDPRLIDETPEGQQLPRIANDGQRPMDVYARPRPDGAGGVPEVAILITGIGMSRTASIAAIKSLPPEVSLVVSPYAKDPNDWVLRARLAGHEVYMGLPMESREFPLEDAGPLALDSRLQLELNVARLHNMMASMTGYVGLVGRYGSKFGVAEGQLRPILSELKDRGLMFVDSGETGSGAISKIAGEIELPKAVSNLTLDANPLPNVIDGQLARLHALGRAQAVAVATARPLPVTLERIRDWLSKLDQNQLRLVPVSAIADRQILQ